MHDLFFIKQIFCRFVHDFMSFFMWFKIIDSKFIEITYLFDCFSCRILNDFSMFFDEKRKIILNWFSKKIVCYVFVIIFIEHAFYMNINDFFSIVFVYDLRIRANVVLKYKIKHRCNHEMKCIWTKKMFDWSKQFRLKKYDRTYIVYFENKNMKIFQKIWLIKNLIWKLID